MSSIELAKPNLVFFMMDQLSAKWLEGDMAAACPTPNIDQLRREGVTFARCLSSNPVCCPGAGHAGYRPDSTRGTWRAPERL